LVEGSEPSLFTERTGLAFSLLESRLAQAEECGLLERDWRRVRPSERGRRFLNELLQAFL
jgi:coproporphyrinogen III oxidase-like Fe-S oxidoreductase